jgi:hypothetical protein
MNEAKDEYFEGDVVAAYPLALLESVRAHDHPGEVLEEEDLTVSLPRRLGLSGVVETQIMRYESAQRAGRTVSLNEVIGLLRLVLRRPDAELIVRETGVRIADARYARVSTMMKKLYRTLPLRAGMIPIARAADRLFRDLGAGSEITVHRSPFYVRVKGSNTAKLDDTSVGCGLFTAALEQHLAACTGRFWTVDHAQCERTGEACEWRAEQRS